MNLTTTCRMKVHGSLTIPRGEWITEVGGAYDSKVRRFSIQMLNFEVELWVGLNDYRITFTEAYGFPILKGGSIGANRTEIGRFNTWAISTIDVPEELKQAARNAWLELAAKGLPS